MIKKEYNNGNIVIKDIDKKEYYGLLREFRIGEGEASIFVLCNKYKDCLILTDDKKLITLCRLEKKNFASSMAIVVRMYEEKLIDKKTAIEKLDKLFAYGRYTIELYEYFKGQVM